MISIFVGIFFIFLQGFFASSEIAFVSSNMYRIMHLFKAGKINKKTYEYANIDREELLILILIVTNICVVVSSTLFSRFFIGIFGSNGVIYAIVIVTLLGLVFGEYLPKLYSSQNPEKIVIKTGYIFYILSFVFFPIIKFIRLFKKDSRNRTIERTQLVAAFKEGEKIGSILKGVRQMVVNLLYTESTKINDIFVPWNMVIKLKKGFTVTQIRKVLQKESYSRYPVIDNRGNVIGVLHIKDVLTEKRLREPLFIDGENNVLEAFHIMQKERKHMAIVRDRMHNILGIVTMEDILEEITGEIKGEE